MSKLVTSNNASRSLKTELPRYLKKRELADHLNVSLSTIQRLLRRGLPSLIVGGQHRFDVAKVTDWLQQHGA